MFGSFFGINDAPHAVPRIGSLRTADQPKNCQGHSFFARNQPARNLSNRIRAFTPWPGAFCWTSDHKPLLLKIWSAEVDVGGKGAPGTILSAGKAGIVVACADQSLRILELQREGGRRLKAQEFLLGHPLKAGERLT